MNADTIDQQIGKRIRDLRKAQKDSRGRKMTQGQLASRIGVSTTAVGNWEKAKNSLVAKHLLPLVAELKTSVDYLMLQSDDPQPRTSSPNEPSTAPGVIGEISGSYGFGSTKATGQNDLDAEGIPIYKDLKFAVDDWLSVRKSPVAVVRYSKSLLDDLNVSSSSSAFFFRLRDNHNEPEYKNGATIGINCSCREILDGRYYAIVHEGLAKFVELENVSLTQVSVKTAKREEIVPVKSIQVIGQFFAYWYFTRTG